MPFPDRFINNRFNALLSAYEISSRKDFRMGDICNIMWGFAYTETWGSLHHLSVFLRLDFVSEDCVYTLLRQMPRVIQNITPRQLSNCIWSLAKLNVSSSETVLSGRLCKYSRLSVLLFKHADGIVNAHPLVLSRRMSARPPSMGPFCIADFVWGLHRLLGPASNHHLFGDVACRILDIGWIPQSDIKRIFWSFAVGCDMKPVTDNVGLFVAFASRPKTFDALLQLFCKHLNLLPFVQIGPAHAT